MSAAGNPDGYGGEEPYHLVAGDPACGLLLLCDHARNRLPAAYGDLGVAPAEFRRHIAYDIGAEALTRRLAGQLSAPAVLSSFSRLLIDINRGEDDPTLIMRLSDGAIVPGNHRVDGAERARRIAAYHAPYHDAVSAAVDRALGAGRPPILVSIHSFTPFWRGVPRPWQVGVLWDHDPRFSRALIARLAEDASLTVGDNEPYAGGLPGDTLYRHGIERGLAHAIIEVRQDLIGSDEGIAEWTARLAPPIAALNGDPELHVVRHHLPGGGQPRPGY